MCDLEREKTIMNICSWYTNLNSSSCVFVQTLCTNVNDGLILHDTKNISLSASTPKKYGYIHCRICILKNVSNNADDRVEKRTHSDQINIIQNAFMPNFNPSFISWVRLVFMFLEY